MRVLLLALAVALADLQFRPGLTYVYDYEAVVNTGLPEEGLARAGFKIKSIVTIRAEGANLVLLELKEPKIFEFSGYWPKDEFTEAPALTHLLSEHLLKAVKFEYINGAVGKVFTQDGVPESVVNIIRGILNTINLKIKSTQNVYELQEAGALGVCKSQYVIKDDPKRDLILLTKTKDMNECQEKIIKDIGLAYTESCPECVAREKVLKGAAVSNYEIKQDAQAQSYMIMAVTAMERLHFSPFNILNGAAQMEAKQSLVFRETKTTQEEPSRAVYKEHGTIQYVFSNEALLNPIHLLKYQSPLQLSQILRQLRTQNVDQAHENAPQLFIDLVMLFRKAAREDFINLWEQYKNQPEYRRWLLYGIVPAGTTAALRFIKDRVSELTFAETAQALMGSAQMMIANEETIRELSREFENQPYLHEMAMMSYGTLIGKYCAENPTCSDDFVKPIHERLANNDREMALLLKVLGNAGHPASLKPIMKLLPGFGSATVDLKVQLEAVAAMKRIAKKEPKMVQVVAIQLFLNREIQPELRMAAAMTLFETKVSMAMAFTIANAVLQESNMQLASFVYTYMNSMAKNTAPDLASAAAVYKVALRILNPVFGRKSLRYSKALYFDAFYEPWMVGAAGSVFIINKAATIVPQAVIAKARSYLAGAYADVFEIGVRTDGLQDALMKLHKPLEGAEKKLRMRELVKILSDWTASPSRDPLLSLSVKFFGQEIAFANIDQTIIDLFTQVVYHRLLFVHTISQPLLGAEVRRIIPSSVGLPYDVTFITAAVAAASLEAQATVTPALREQDNYAAQLLKSDINLRAAFTPSVSVHTYALVGVNSEFLKAGLRTTAKVHTVLPVKLQAKVDVNEGNYVFSWHPDQTMNKIASAHVDTMAVVEDMSASKETPLIPTKTTSTSQMVSANSYSSEIIPIYPPTYKHVEKYRIPRSYKKKLCGGFKTYEIKACAQIKSRSAAFIRESPLYAVMGHHAFSVDVHRGDGLESIQIEIQTGEKAAEKIIKRMSQSEEEEILENKNVLLKLKKILVPGLTNSTGSSSSSSRSHSSSSSVSSHSSHSSHSSRSSRSSRSSSSSSSSRSSSSSSHTVLSRMVQQKSSSSSSSTSSQSSSRSSSRSSSSRSSRRSSRRSSSSSSSRSTTLLTYDEVCEGDNHLNLISVFLQFQLKYLSDVITPFAVVLITARKSDNLVRGYQIAGYMDKPNARVQVIALPLAENDPYKFIVDGVMLSEHKMMAKLNWGKNGKQYDTNITAETGLMHDQPAFRLKMAWKRLPCTMKHKAQWMVKYIHKIIEATGADLAKGRRNMHKQVKMTVVATSDASLNITVRIPKVTIHKNDVALPFSLKLGELEPYVHNMIEKFYYMLLKPHSAECSVDVTNKLRTFNDVMFTNHMATACYQILAQDCTPELRFIVLLKKDARDNNYITVKIADIDVDMFVENGEVKVKVNNHLISKDDTYQQGKNKIVLKYVDEKAVLFAPSYGLDSLHYDLREQKVKIVEAMRGKTCGLCGWSDGEQEQEYRIPNRRVTKNAASFGNSWVMPGRNCTRDIFACNQNKQSVKLDRHVNIQGVESRCYSTDSVLRCMEGCQPLRTTAVSMNFHCMPANSNMARTEILSNIYGKTVDLTENVDAHLACRCSAQCA
uniref:Uncharacterized protein n=1 Tax=Sphaeramia orbicularis TaxID=375764 RepID=A0A673BW88_9TELE